MYVLHTTSYFNHCVARIQLTNETQRQVNHSLLEALSVVERTLHLSLAEHTAFPTESSNATVYPSPWPSAPVKISPSYEQSLGITTTQKSRTLSSGASHRPRGPLLSLPSSFWLDPVSLGKLQEQTRITEVTRPPRWSQAWDDGGRMTAWDRRNGSV
ncbi:unnamed protein product [Ranitomeya imitator]|uniref:Uncharacterized protein n=1 Tax=Ranitomeya imitator TaxID=111125 RepID=A0ABN9KP91_9NEOB|nr:unnamed protein product [Ranitomeya imitator]